MKADISVDAGEVARFSLLAETWWDEQGSMKPLHAINPVRMKYLRDRIAAHFERNAGQPAPLAGLSAVDIGCGGGLVCEPMTRLGATVTGIDASEKNIAVAAIHAEKTGLAVTYRHASAEDLVAEKAAFDVVLALEVVEHVADVASFVFSCAALVKPGGLIVMSTLNRTPQSFLFAIVGAEYALRWLPRGTHDWRKFLRPSELAGELRRAGVHIEDLCGLGWNTLRGDWELQPRGLSVNYFVTGSKP